MLRGAAGGGDTSPMCGAVLNARKHRTTPLVKPRASPSRIAPFLTPPLPTVPRSRRPSPLAPRARDCTVSPRTLPAHHRPQASCVARGNVPSSSPHAPSPSPATAPTAPASVGRRRCPVPLPRRALRRLLAPAAGQLASHPTATSPRSQRRATAGGWATATERPSRARARGSPSSLPLGGASLPPRRVRRQRLRQRGESRCSARLRRRPEPLVGVMRGGAPGGPRPMSYVAT